MLLPVRATLLHTLCPHGTDTHCPWQAGQRLSLEQLGWAGVCRKTPWIMQLQRGRVLRRLMVSHWHCHHACHSKDVDVRAALALGPCECSSSAASISRGNQCCKNPIPTSTTCSCWHGALLFPVAQVPSVPSAPDPCSSHPLSPVRARCGQEGMGGMGSLAEPSSPPGPAAQSSPQGHLGPLQGPSRTASSVQGISIHGQRCAQSWPASLRNSF